MPGHAVLIKRRAECRAHDALLGDGLDSAACAEACAAVPGCHFFVHGTGSKSGECYHEFAADETCPEGWEADDFDFYKLVRWTHVGSARLRRHRECGSADSKLGEFPGRVDLCAAACARKTGCHFFIFGTSSLKAGHCWHEFTSADECPEGWEDDSYDFYELTGAPWAPRIPDLPDTAAPFLTGFATACALLFAFVLLARRHACMRRCMIAQLRNPSDRVEADDVGVALAEPRRLAAVHAEAELPARSLLGPTGMAAERSDSRCWSLGAPSESIW